MSLMKGHRSLVASSSRTVLGPALSRGLTEYRPSRDYDPSEPERPPRPSVSTFFTGRPTYYSALSTLRSTLHNAQSILRTSHIYPLPNSLPLPQPPRATFHSPEALSALMGVQLRTNTHREILGLLNELHQIRYLATLSSKGDVASMVDDVLAAYERPAERSVATSKTKGGVDEWGRAYAMGRRKESSARVWMVRNPKAPLDAPLPADGQGNREVPVSEVLVNHLPLTEHFARPSDREAVLRPLHLTGLLGAYNIFALVRGGGTTGQAGAIALGVARALAILREDTRDVLKSGKSFIEPHVLALMEDGALMRDTRMVERKKTGNGKARKKYAWVKR